MWKSFSASLLKSSIEKFANGWLFEAATRKLFDQKFR